MFRPTHTPPLRGGVSSIDAHDGGTDEFDNWIEAHLTTTAHPVGTIATQTGSDAELVQAALDRLAAGGRFTDHSPAGNGPRTWSLPDRDLDQWPTIPPANTD